MKCDKALEITAYLKGETAEAEREPLRLHFEGCATCTAELARFDRLLKALGKMEGIDPSPGFKWRVREAFLRAHPEFLERPRPETYTWMQSLRHSFSFVPAWAISIAAHVLLVALAAILIFVPKSPEEEMNEAAIRAKPRQPSGVAPDFGRGTDLPGGRTDRVVGHMPPSGGEAEDFTPSRPAQGAIVPAPHPLRNPNTERLDISKWRERIPREKRLLAFFEARGDAQFRKVYGGQGTEGAIRSGLDWLAREQLADGRWTGPKVRGEGGAGEFNYSTGLTGLALLAYLAEGHDGRSGHYASTVRRGLEYLLAQQRASGLIGSDQGHYMYDHAIAGLALLEAAMMTHDEGLVTAASAAVNFTISAQNPTGGWGYVSRSPSNDTSVGGWQILLLRLAKLGGNHGVIASLVQAHDRLALLTDSEGKVGYRARQEFPNGHLALTAVGMLGHQMSTHTPDAEVLARQAGVLLEQSPVASTDPAGYMMNDLYFGLFGSLALHQHGGDGWTRWFSPLREKLLKTQQKDGAWPADFDRWCGHGGPVYSTAMALLILETPVRYPRLIE